MGKLYVIQEEKYYCPVCGQETDEEVRMCGNCLKELLIGLKKLK